MFIFFSVDFFYVFIGNSDDNLSIVASFSNTIHIYQNTTMKWAAHSSIVPIAMTKGTFKVNIFLYNPRWPHHSDFWSRHAPFFQIWNSHFSLIIPKSRHPGDSKTGFIFFLAWILTELYVRKADSSCTITQNSTISKKMLILK